LLALAASAALGVIGSSVWGEEPAAPQGKQTPTQSGQPSPALAKLGVTTRGATIPDSGNTTPAKLFRIAPIAATASSPNEGDEEWIPENLRDPGFDRYIDLALLCKAWDEKDASALADVALQLREGERILMRPHRGFSSQQLLQEAARIAAETKETEALQRLRKIADTIGSTELKAKLASAEKLAGPARASDPALQVSIAEMTPEVFAELWEYLHAIQDASLAGDTATLKEIQNDLTGNGGIPQMQKKYLHKLLQESQATAAALPESQKQLSQALDKLSDSSRKGPGGGGGGKPAWSGGGGGGKPAWSGGGGGGKPAWSGKPGGGKPAWSGPHPVPHSAHYSGPYHGHHHGWYYVNGVWVYRVGGDVPLAEAVGPTGLWFENLRDKPATVAIAYYDVNSGPTWTVAGWYGVQPGERVCVVSGDLTNRTYYYYAFSSDYRWEGDSNSYYVNPHRAFSYDSQDPVAVSSVRQQGYENHGFNAIDSGGAPYYLVPLQ
jgi:uncharacterized membrane protein